MRILVIEDELPAAHRLIFLIGSCQGEADILGPLASNEDVMGWFAVNELPDLIFSDIELLDGPVFSALEQLEISVPIIFTTAYDHYALEAFDTSGISYLTKPFEQKDIQRALDKFEELKRALRDKDQHQLISELKKIKLGPDNYRSRFTIKLGNGMHLLSVADITCIRTANGLPYAYKEGNKKWPLSEQMNELETQLDPRQFFRLNRGEIVNINHIERVENYFNDRLAVIVNGQAEPIITSAARTSEFRKWLGN